MVTLEQVAETLASAAQVEGVVVLNAELAREMAVVVHNAAQGVPSLVSRDVLLERHASFLTPSRLKGILKRHRKELIELGIVMESPSGDVGQGGGLLLFDEAQFLEWIRHRGRGQIGDTHLESVGSRPPRSKKRTRVKSNDSPNFRKIAGL